MHFYVHMYVCVYMYMYISVCVCVCESEVSQNSSYTLDNAFWYLSFISD